VQVDLAAAATDNELIVEERRRADARREADPVKAITSMATVLGGKIVLVQGIRLILSVCLLVSSVAAFYTLITYTKLNVPMSLAIVVAANVALASVLLTVVVLQKSPNRTGLAELLGGGSRKNRAAEQLASVLPTAFEPVIHEAVTTMRKLRDGTGHGPRISTEGSTAGRDRGAQKHRHLALPTVQGEVVAARRGGMPLGGAARRSFPDPGNERPRMLSKVVDTGEALIGRLPVKHRESQMAKLAQGVLSELREFAAQQAAQGGGGHSSRGSGSQGRSDMAARRKRARDASRTSL
jgi:hypothetical protein